MLSMTTINGLLEKYQHIESLFMTKEIEDFKKEIEAFRRELIGHIRTLEAMNDKGQNTEAIRILNNLIGKNF